MTQFIGTKSTEDILADRHAIYRIISDYKIIEAKSLLWSLLSEMHYVECKLHPERKRNYDKGMKECYNAIINSVENKLKEQTK
jgi:hypothetical protein